MNHLTPETTPIVIKLLVVFTNQSKSTVLREVKKLRIKLRKTPDQKVMLADYCDFYGYSRKKACEFFEVTYIPEDDPVARAAMKKQHDFEKAINELTQRHLSTPVNQL